MAIQTIDLSTYHALPESLQITLSATASDATVITLPNIRCKVTIGPIRTNAAEGTTEAGAFTIGPSTVADLAAFKGDSISTGLNRRRYMVAGEAYELVLGPLADRRNRVVAVEGVSASAILELALDAAE